MRFLKNKKAQNTAEYAIIIGLVVAAAAAMQTYVKRGLQGGMKFAVDKAGKLGGTDQYEPYYLESSYETTTSKYKDTEETKAGGEVERKFGADDKKKTTTRSGHERIRDTSGAD